MPRLNLVTAIFFVLAVAPSSFAQDLFREGQFASYQPDEVNGETVFHASGCATCHSVEGDLGLLAGGRAFSNRQGTIFAPNITHNRDAGIGAWSDAEFLNALMRGVAPDGSAYLSAYFPYPAYGLMKPEDALDLRAFMKTLPESELASKDHKINRLGRMVLEMSSNDRAPLAGHSDAQMSRGEYLVEALGHCGECHTPRRRMKLNTDAAFTGYIGYFGGFAPNISADRLRDVDPAAFINGTLVEGKKLSGAAISTGFMRRVVAATSKLGVDDRAAIFAYLSGRSVDVTSIPSAKPTAPAISPATSDENIVLAYEQGASSGWGQQLAGFCETPKKTSANLASSVGVIPKGVVTAADQVMDTFCRNCHGPGQRNEAIFPMHDISEIALDSSAVQPGNAEGSLLYQSIDRGLMPYGPKLTKDQQLAIKTWIDALGNTPAPTQTTQVETEAEQIAAKAPKYLPGSMDEIFLAATTDLKYLPENDREFTRYFNFINVALPQIECAPDGTATNPVTYLHAGLNKFINSVSFSPTLSKVVPVDGTDGALVRIDIRDYNWTIEDWKVLSEGIFGSNVERADFTRDAWRDLAEIYPYAIDPASDPLLGVIADATKTAVPILNADWFVRFGSQSPYYDVLLRLTGDVKDLEHRIGIDVDYEISQGNVVRAGFTNSGVSDHNRMLERFDLPRGGYYWKSYDFAGDRGAQLLLTHPDGPNTIANLSSGTPPFEHDGGEMIFSLPNGLQGYYLSEADGRRLLVGPTSIVSFRNKPIGKGVEIVNARSCFDCHANGILRKNDEIRSHISVSNAFSRHQKEALLDMYPPQDQLESYYNRDRDAFINALSYLDAVETTDVGAKISLSGPASSGNAEIVTYLADVQFNRLDLEQTARVFTLTPQEFRDRINTMGDPHLMRLASGWLNRFDLGEKITRQELNDVWADMLPRLTDFQSYNFGADEYIPVLAEDYDLATESALEEEVLNANAFQSKVDELEPFVPTTKPSDPLTLSLSVADTKPRVNDILQIQVATNRRCELQILYIEETEKVEEFPQAVLGPVFLEAGEVRSIPYPDAGFQLRFDTPGQGETLVAFCREGGLEDQRITAAKATEYANTRFLPLSRGLIVERTDTVLADEGRSAVNAITFNVAP